MLVTCMWHSGLKFHISGQNPKVGIFFLKFRAFRGFRVAGFDNEFENSKWMTQHDGRVTSKSNILSWNLASWGLRVADSKIDFRNSEFKMADDFPEKLDFYYNISIDLSFAMTVPRHSHTYAAALNVDFQKNV